LIHDKTSARARLRAASPPTARRSRNQPNPCSASNHAGAALSGDQSALIMPLSALMKPIACPA